MSPGDPPSLLAQGSMPGAGPAPGSPAGAGQVGGRLPARGALSLPPISMMCRSGEGVIRIRPKEASNPADSTGLPQLRGLGAPRRATSLGVTRGGGAAVH